MVDGKIFDKKDPGDISGKILPWAGASMELRFLGLMLTLPFLIPYHIPPVASFYSEWLALFYGVVACILLFIKPASLTIVVPRIATMPVALVLVVLLQWQSGMFAYDVSALGIFSYMLWALLLMIIGASLALRDGIRPMVVALAWFLLWGASANALIGIAQFAGIASYFKGLMMMPMDLGVAGVYGNLGQQNHFVTHLSVGLLSATFLCFSKQMVMGRYAIYLSLLLCGIFLSAARSGLVYVILIGVLFGSVMMKAKHQQVIWRKIVLIFAIVCVCCLVLVAILMFTHINSPQVARWIDIYSAFGPRFYLWKHALIMFFENPVVGVGFDDYASHLLHQVADLQEPVVWGIDRSAHNIILHLFAVSGLLGAAAFCIPLIFFSYSQRSVQFSLVYVWLWGVIGILLIHSLLEQPLFYAYFLGCAALVVGISDRHCWQFKVSKQVKLYCVVSLILLLSVLFVTGRDYMDFSRLQSRLEQQGSVFAPQGSLERKRIIGLQRFSFLAPYVELNFPALFVRGATSPGERLKFNTRVLRYSPIPEVELRQSLYLFQDGQFSAAVAHFERVAYVYPNAALNFYRELVFQSKLNPDISEQWLESLRLVLKLP